MESGNSTENMVSRRTTRIFAEEEIVMAVTRDSRNLSGDELDREQEKTRSRASSIGMMSVDVMMFPVVDLGKDLSRTFPTSVDDMGKQVVKSLQAAKASTKEKTDNRPINFGEVFPGRIYRSSFPVEEDVQFLKTLGLKTIVSLVKKDFSPEFTAFMKGNAITHRVVEMQGTKKVDISETIMKSIMEIVLDKENYPVLIHCNHGKHRTGCAVAVIRHVAGWNCDEIVEEYKGYANPKVRDCDVKYIEEYKVSTLHHLFVKHEIHRRQPAVLVSPRMAQLIMFTIIVLGIWFATLYFW